jgi:Transposase, Mutator family
MGRIPRGDGSHMHDVSQRLPGSRLADTAWRGPLKIPKLREGRYFPSLLEPRRQAEQALLAVIQQAYIQGVSNRRVDELVKAIDSCASNKRALETFRKRSFDPTTVLQDSTCLNEDDPFGPT